MGPEYTRPSLQLRPGGGGPRAPRPAAPAIRVPLQAVLLTAGLLITSLLALLTAGSCSESALSQMPLLTHHRVAATTPACCCGRSTSSGAASSGTAGAAAFDAKSSRQLLKELRAGQTPGVCKCPAAPGQPELRVPRLLHHVFLPDAAALAAQLASPASPLKEHWALSCVRAHPGWRHIYWDAASATALLKERYPSLLPTFRAFNDTTRQADLLRYAVVHAFGGLYLDMDVQCLRPAEDMLAGHDVVLQGSVPEEPLASATLASVPRHPLWAMALQMAAQRWQEDPTMSVVLQTGPGLLHAAATALGMKPSGDGTASPLAGVHAVGGSSIKVHPLGTFFMPCWWCKADCHRRTALQLAAGTTPANLAGYHRFVASWTRRGNAEGLFSEADVERAVVEAAAQRGAAGAAPGEGGAGSVAAAAGAGAVGAALAGNATLREAAVPNAGDAG